MGVGGGGGGERGFFCITGKNNNNKRTKQSIRIYRDYSKETFLARSLSAIGLLAKIRMLTSKSFCSRACDAYLAFRRRESERKRE